jgi:hypothetical protein
MGCVRPSSVQRRVVYPRVTSTHKLDFEVFRRCQVLDRFGTRVILSQACALLQSITNSCSSTPTTYLVTHRNEPRDMLRWSTTFRGLFPFSVFPTIRSLEPQLHSNATRPYVLRVSHPHDVLLPKPSAGPISFRYRSWDFCPSRRSSCANAGNLLRLPDPHDL